MNKNVRCYDFNILSIRTQSYQNSASLVLTMRRVWQSRADNPNTTKRVGPTPTNMNACMHNAHYTVI